MSTEPELVKLALDGLTTDCGDPVGKKKVGRSLRITSVPDGEVLFRWSIAEAKSAKNWSGADALRIARLTAAEFAA